MIRSLFFRTQPNHMNNNQKQTFKITTPYKLIEGLARQQRPEQYYECIPYMSVIMPSKLGFQLVTRFHLEPYELKAHAHLHTRDCAQIILIDLAGMET